MGKIINVLLTAGKDKDRDLITTTMSIQNDIRIIGIEKDETGTIIKSERLQPDVLILDIQPQGIGGDILAPIIHRRSPSTAIIMLSDRDDENYACLALKAGISGYLLKKKDTDKLTSVVKIVFLGGYYISASIILKVFSASAFFSQFPGQITGQTTGINFKFFTTAERGIVTDLAQGYSDMEIAEHLHFSAGTIRNYLTAIKRKTKLRNRVQIVLYSLVYGFIRLEHLDIWKTDRQFANNAI